MMKMMSPGFFWEIEKSEPLEKRGLWSDDYIRQLKSCAKLTRIWRPEDDAMNWGCFSMANLSSRSLRSTRH